MVTDIQKVGRFYRREKNVFYVGRENWTTLCANKIGRLFNNRWQLVVGRFYWQTKSANFIDRLTSAFEIFSAGLSTIGWQGCSIGQWRRHTRHKVKIHNVLYLISELFRSVRKTCSCVHSGQLILKKISKTGATRCQILGLKCTKFDFRWGSAPEPAGRTYSTRETPATSDRERVLKKMGQKKRGWERIKGKRKAS